MCSIHDDLTRALATLKASTEECNETVKAIARGRIERKAAMEAAFDTRMDALIGRMTR